MRKILVLLLMILLLVAILTSCTKKVEYPEYLTPEYCRENYVVADYNLRVVYANLKGGILDYDPPVGTYEGFYAIKDISVDEYLYTKCGMILSTEKEVFRNKKLELSEQEILSYDYKSVELLFRWGAPADKLGSPWTAVAAYKEKESVAALDGAEADAFQAYIIECLNTGNYVEHTSQGKFPREPVMLKRTQNGISTEEVLSVRVSFSEYENLVWETHIDRVDKNYYMYFYWWTADEFYPEDYYKIIHIPLPEEIAKLIPET